jgi:glycosyltransferase involved in cell wall biosynthesis
MLPMLLNKDVGAIPLTLARDFGWDAELVTWQAETQMLIEPEGFSRWVRHRSLGTFRSRAARTAALTRYLLRNAGGIDVLLAYHLTSESLAALALFKLLNPSGRAVLKLDMDHRGLSFFEGPRSPKQGLLWQALRAAPIDLITVETQTIARRIEPALRSIGRRLELFPVGIAPSEATSPAPRRRVVLTAGRLGIEQKNNELLLDAIQQLPQQQISNWQFWFVGARTKTLDDKISRLRAERPDLSPLIVCRDFVASRSDLAELYEQVSVYCLTSRWESVGIVLLEAAQHGCFIVSSRVGVAEELTNAGALGCLFDSGDLAGLVQALLVAIDRHDEHPREALRQRARAYEWPTLCARFVNVVNELSTVRGVHV